jgi:hypothetical protein
LQTRVEGRNRVASRRDIVVLNLPFDECALSANLLRLLLFVPAVLAGCAAQMPAGEAALQAAWVELPGPQVRAIVDAGVACPRVMIDGVAMPMRVRAGAATPAQRSSIATQAKAASFPIEVCEAALPREARVVRVGSRALPVPRAPIRRIVVLGDTGCRIKDSYVQRCNDPDGWPFGRVAAAAASLAPDLVLHVGDYHYRETPCPSGQSACAGSPWGYGWDAWQADFFAPAASLLAAAPWVFVRGNHEECSRAGQGWFRLLAPEPLDPRRSCDDPANDDVADFSKPYAVPLGAGLQLVIFDSARAGNGALKPGLPRDTVTRDAYEMQAREVTALAEQPATASWFVSHHPVLGFTPDPEHPGGMPRPGNPALQGAFHSANGLAYFPGTVQLALHGHVHLFEALSFSSGHPVTVIAGNGGDTMDNRLPPQLAPGLSPAPGVAVATLVDAPTFGFLMLERNGVTNDWTFTAYRSDLQVLARCLLTADRQLQCNPAAPL